MQRWQYRQDLLDCVLAGIETGTLPLEGDDDVAALLAALVALVDARDASYGRGTNARARAETGPRSGGPGYPSSVKSGR